MHEDDSKGIIIKVDTSGHRGLRESKAHEKVLRKSGDFGKKHLAQVAYSAQPMSDGGWITFQSVAGGGFGTLVSFDEMLRRHDDPAATCQKIVSSLLSEWNAKTVKPGPASAGQLLRELLDDRIEPGGTLHEWASRHNGLLDEPHPWLYGSDGPLINPFALAKNDRIGGALLLTPFRGHSHGDLHPGNLLVAETATEPVDYALIDLSRYRTDGLLAWDPCYLMCTTVAMRLQKGDSINRARLREVLLTPNPDKIDGSIPRDLRHTISGIAQGERDYAERKGLLEEWPQQRLVCLTAIALILSGRTLLEPPERQWFFWLAAHAATEMLRPLRIDVEKPLPLRVELIRHPALDSNTATGGRPGAREDRLAAGQGSGTGPIYHDAACEALRKRLTEGPSGVVVVTGPRGVGKTTLVTASLSDMGVGRPQVYWTPTVEGLRLDAKTLIDCIEGAAPALADGAVPTVHLRREASSPARLQAALDAAVNQQVIIVVEDAERLLAPDGALADAELDETFESLTTRVDHRVSVILVSGVVPKSPTGGTWPAAEPPITISRLRYDHFVKMLRDRPGGFSRLRRLDDDAFGVLYRALQGNPRLTNLFHAVCVLAAHRVRLQALVDELSCLEPKEVPDALLCRLIDDLDEPTRRVLEGLAAFRVPVPEESIMALLEEHQPEEDTLHGLERLVDSMLVRRVGDRYELTEADAAWVLDRMPEETRHGYEGRFDLQENAATCLHVLREQNPRTVGDLHIHFAEVHAMIGARRFEAAYEMIEALDERLREWNSRYLLLEYREALCGRMEDKYLEMANDNALAWIHRSRGRFHMARAAYRRALEHAETLGNDVARLKVSANLAAMSWLDNDPGEAHKKYEEALAGAERLGDPVVRMGALEGLADCYRRRGQFGAAIKRGKQAYAVPEEAGYPATSAARRSASRRVNLALKLSRWHAETGRLFEAHQWLAKAQQEVDENADWSHQAALLNGRADLLLRDGDMAAALDLGTKAAALAIKVHDPMVLTQARTTLCMAHLAADRPNDAAREIQTIVRYRRSGRSLIVLALAAVVARKQRRIAIARTRFNQLRHEAEERFRDPDDFAARDFAALAMCADVLDHKLPIEDALNAFREARLMAPDSTGLREHLKFLVNQLDLCGRPRGQLLAVIAVLQEASPGHEPE
ncbi:AAA family ATPase [Micromonospora sp. NPDC047793]|uniref:AAA family ATPase n=1 Tax=unclassified Micromonospora TaxID=2617518 RepID=UPI0033F21A9B